MPKLSEFTVLATSAWQGDGWQLIAITETRKAAQAIADAIYTADPRSTGHIVAVCGQAKPHPTMDFAYIVDTSRVKINGAHLRARRCTVNATAWMVDDEPVHP